MSSAISSIAPNVVHEAVDERQHVRSKLPARVVLSGADDSFACELQDISLGGLGLRCSRELPQGALYDAAIQLELNQVALTIDARVKVIAERGGLTGVEFVELEPRKRDILLRQLSESGANYFVCRFAFGDLTFDEAQHSLRLFVDHAMPAMAAEAAE